MVSDIISSIVHSIRQERDDIATLRLANSMFSGLCFPIMLQFNYSSLFLDMISLLYFHATFCSDFHSHNVNQPVNTLLFINKALVQPYRSYA